LFRGKLVSLIRSACQQGELFRITRDNGGQINIIEYLLKYAYYQGIPGMELLFFSTDNHTLYRQYLALKTSIFINERHLRGLKLPLDARTAEPEEADK
jgi:hypothetical protein